MQYPAIQPESLYPGWSWTWVCGMWQAHSTDCKQVAIINDELCIAGGSAPIQVVAAVLRANWMVR